MKSIPVFNHSHNKERIFTFKWNLFYICDYCLSQKSSCLLLDTTKMSMVWLHLYFIHQMFTHFDKLCPEPFFISLNSFSSQPLLVWQILHFKGKNGAVSAKYFLQWAWKIGKYKGRKKAWISDSNKKRLKQLNISVFLRWSIS